MTAKRTSTGNRQERIGRLRWVHVRDIKTPAHAQRDLKQSKVDKILSEFEPEELGHPILSLRGGVYYVIDGQHRVAAARAFFDDDVTLQCEVYEGLTEQEEADKFLRRNDTLAVDAMAKFRIGVNAGRDVECDIDRVVRAQGLVVSRDKLGNSISAVGTLRRVYGRAGGPTLGRVLRIIRDAYGEPGLEAAVIDGIGLVCQRYNGQLSDEDVVVKLGNARGGVNGLLNRAEQLRKQTGNQKAHCVAAAAVEIANRGRGGKKLPDWWKATP